MHPTRANTFCHADGRGYNKKVNSALVTVVYLRKKGGLGIAARIHSLAEQAPIRNRAMHLSDPSALSDATIVSVALLP